MKSLLAAIGSVVTAGWVLRAWPALAAGGWVVEGIGYDAGVYFSASALLWEGVVPYRDFAHVHPPGMFVFLAPLAAASGALGAAQAYSLACWLATLVGAVNIALSARLAYRAAGPVAALLAAVCYALFAEAIGAERRPVLDPFLNLACLSCAYWWLSRRVEQRPRWALVAGLFLGLACMVKLTGLVWVAACLASATSRRALAFLGVGAAVAIAALTVPFLLAAPSAFLDQTILFQLTRPPDGAVRVVDRVRYLSGLTFPIAALATLGAVTHRKQPETAWRGARFFVVGGLLLLGAFLLSPSYWPWYNAQLAPAMAHLAALGGAWVWSLASTRSRRLRVAVAAALIATLVPSLARGVARANRAAGTTKPVAALRRVVPDGACYFAFEPGWGVAADRLPSPRAGGAIVNDVYATMLLAARSDPAPHPTASHALLSRPAQDRIRSVLSGCDYLSLGRRGGFQLTPETREWIAARWEKVEPRPGAAGLDLWRLRR